MKKSIIKYSAAALTGALATIIFTQATTEPEVIVETKEVEVPVEVIKEVEVVKEVEVTKEVVPASCLDALAEAEKVFDASAEFADVTSQIMSESAVAIEAAYFRNDFLMSDSADRLEVLIGQIDGLTNQVLFSEYPGLAESCRNA